MKGDYKARRRPLQQVPAHPSPRTRSEAYVRVKGTPLHHLPYPGTLVGQAGSHWLGWVTAGGHRSICDPGPGQALSRPSWTSLYLHNNYAFGSSRALVGGGIDGSRFLVPWRGTGAMEVEVCMYVCAGVCVRVCVCVIV